MKELDEGSLPPSLQTLELNSNQLSSIPKGLSDLPNLTHLSMANNNNAGQALLLLAGWRLNVNLRLVGKTETRAVAP